jgi:hypothetical protein
MSADHHCQLIVYHDKVLKTPKKPAKQRTAATEGKLDHAFFSNYFVTLTYQEFMEFIASGNPRKCMFDKLSAMVPSIVPSRFLPKIAVHIENFVIHEMERWQSLLAFFNGDTALAWDHYYPIAAEYKWERPEYGLKFRADIIFKVPANFYGRHPLCLKIEDYKTGHVSPFSKGINSFTGEALGKPIIVSPVKNQIIFEALMIETFHPSDLPNLPILFGGVLYTIDNTYLVEPISGDDKGTVLDNIVKLRKRIANRDFRFNPWWCKFCDFCYACTGALSIDEKMTIYKLSESQKKDKGESRTQSMARQKRARELLFNAIDIIHQTIPVTEITSSDDEYDDIEEDIDGSE